MSALFFFMAFTCFLELTVLRRWVLLEKGLKCFTFMLSSRSLRLYIYIYYIPSFDNAIGGGNLATASLGEKTCGAGREPKQRLATCGSEVLLPGAPKSPHVPVGAVQGVGSCVLACVPFASLEPMGLISRRFPPLPPPPPHKKKRSPK